MVKGPSDVEKRSDPSEARRQINKLNRQRARQMEVRLSKLFLGTTRGRVLLSGAGYIKGDCNIPLPNNGGDMLIECKCSALTNIIYGPGIPIRYEWFSKIDREYRAMNSRIGTFAIHFHNFSGDYLFFKVADIPILESVAGKTFTFTGPTLDGRFNKAGKAQITDTLFRVKLLAAMASASYEDSCPNAIYPTFSGEYVIVDALHFKGLLGYE